MNRTKLAKYVSAVMNAPLITLLTFIPLVYRFGEGTTFQLLGITSFFGCFLPLILVVYMLKRGIISDFYANDRNERFIPFMSTIFSYTMGTIALIAVRAPEQITALMACYIVNGVVLLLITMKWKISIHASGIASPVTALVYLLGTRLLPLFLLFLPVAWARVELKAHDKKQVTAGAVISTVLTWLQMAFYVHYVFI
ncbi:MAG: PAP2 family protein [Candidatus Bathyarchaeota archaeon]